MAARLEPAAREPLTVAALHAAHGEFVWRTLARMGVRQPHLEDVYQEVFCVVHRRLAAFAGRSSIKTWLYQVCFRVVAGYRRRAHFRHELLTLDGAADPDVAASTPTPEQDLQRRQASHRVQLLLEGMHTNHRVVFVMFELEGLSCEQISAQIGVPVGTVHSRLHRARKAFTRGLSRDRLAAARGHLLGAS